MKVNCVVVTYNRLTLLKECICAIQKQSIPVDSLWIIDNSSTDGTELWLNTLKEDKSIHIIRTKQNIGGAGGFSLGTKLAVEDGCDYVWLMDDDTIATPDALKHLIAVASDSHAGFVCSKVLWTDGSLHAMNKATLIEQASHNISSQTFGGEECFLSNQCTFVSVMVSSNAVYTVGLPIKDFFIWCDDIEYTKRIHDAGYKGLYVPNSQVIHKTRLNYFPSIDIAPSEMAERFYFQIRNTCYMKRRTTNRLCFYISILNKYRLYIHRLNKRKDKNNYETFKRSIIRGCIDGLHFNPNIEYPKK